MRALLRTRKQLVREKASDIQRLQKTLEDANIKLEVIADIVGKSGRAIIEALIAGESDPAKLAALADAKIGARSTSSATRYPEGSGATTVLCLTSTSNRSIPSMQRSPRSIARWTPT